MRPPAKIVWASETASERTRGAPAGQGGDGHAFDPQRAAEAEIGIAGGVGGAEPGRLRGQRPLRRPDVGALAQDLGRDADDHGLGHGRDRGRGRQTVVDGARRPAEKNGQAIARLGQARLEGRDLGQRLGLGGTGLVEVQAADEAGLVAPAGDLAGLGLESQVLLGQGDPRLKRPDLDIVGDHLGGEGDLRVAEAGGRGFELGGRRLEGAPVRAEDVRLPAGVEAGLIASNWPLRRRLLEVVPLARPLTVG